MQIRLEGLKVLFMRYFMKIVGNAARLGHDGRGRADAD